MNRELESYDTFPTILAPKKVYWGDLPADNALGVYAPDERHLKPLRGWSSQFPADGVPNVIWINWRHGVKGPAAEAMLEDLVLPRVRGDGNDLSEAAVVVGAIVHAILRAAVVRRCHGTPAVVGILVGNHGRPVGADGLLPHFQTMSTVLQHLEAKGFIELHRVAGPGRCSWFRPSPNFEVDISQLEYFCDWHRGLVRVRPDAESGDGGAFSTTLEPEVLRQVETIRQDLININSAVPSMWQAAAVCDLQDRWRLLPHGDFCYSAVYNRGRLDRGGRLYAAFQNLPNRRDHIRETLHWRINGVWQPTVEVDFSALHPSMLYHEMGLPLPDGDLHGVRIQGWFDPAAPDPDKRELLKSINNALPNCGDPGATLNQNRTTANHMAAKQYSDWKKAVTAKYAALGRPMPEGMWLPAIEPPPAPHRPGAIDFEDWSDITQADYEACDREATRAHHKAWSGRHKRKYTGTTPTDIVTALLDRHAALADKMFSGQGLRLQSIDSAIARAVTLYFVEQNKPIVAVHDSFICLKEDEALLRQRMQIEYMKYFGALPRIETKKKKRPNLPPVCFTLAATEKPTTPATGKPAT